MYAKLIIAIMIYMAFVLLNNGMPNLTADVAEMLPSTAHTSQYNLVFWLILMIAAIAIFKPRTGGQP